MIEELLPSGVVAVERWDDNEPAWMFPQESAQLSSAVESRMREFATARSCARQALGKLGFPPTPILRGSRREPLWPSGVVGSITHCRGYRGAAVAMQADVRSIGIDAEIHGAIPADVLKSICIEEELAWMDSASKGIHWDRVIFSAKESVYKAWFPLMQRWLGFEQVAVSINRSDRTFRAHPAVVMSDESERILSAFAGRFLVRDGLVLTATVLRYQP